MNVLIAQALTLLNADRFRDAEQVLAPLHQRDPQNHQIANLLGLALLHQHRHAAAENLFRVALAKDKRNPEFHNHLGCALAGLGHFEEALASLRRALQLNPRFANAHFNLGDTLEKMGRDDEALIAYRRTIQCDPASSIAWSASGRIQTKHGRDEEALLAFRNAVKANPRDGEAHLHLATHCLAMGRFTEGWREYLIRPTRQHALLLHGHTLQSTSPNIFPATLDGSELDIRPEQGIGDLLFFLRFAPELRRRGADLCITVPSQLASLLERANVADRIVTETESPAPWTANTLLAGDLPYRLSMIDGTPPPPPLPLYPESTALLQMQQRLARIAPPPYLGLTWRAGTPGGPEPEHLLSKEIPLEVMGSAIRSFPGSLIALQRLPAPGEIEHLAAVAGRPIHDLTDLNADLEGMLALLALIDGYVGVSNTNMHLRAAVGRTGHVLIPHPAEWRWMRHGSNSPWFPGFPLFRQDNFRDWRQAAADLQASLVGVLH